MKDYTTLEKKEEILNDKEASQEMKDEESTKTIISRDAFAICDFITQLIKKLEHLRVTPFIKR